MKESWMEEIREVRMSKVKHDVYQYKANGCLFSDGVTRVFGENRVIHTDHGNIINSVMPLHDSNGLIKIGYLYSEGGEIVSIEGVPEGWKIKGILKGCDGDSVIDSYGKVITLSGCDVGYYHTIVERDVQIIDMSQCKVDVEFKPKGVVNKPHNWSIDKSELIADPDFLEMNDVRVRQDYYFGWQGGECPLPDGVHVVAYYRARVNGGVNAGDSVTTASSTIKASDLNWSHGENRSEMDIMGFEVLGTADTHIYAHELGGEE